MTVLPLADTSLRRAGPDDLAQLAPLFAAYRQFYRCAPAPEAEAAYLAARLAEPEIGLALALRAGRAVGFVHLYPQPSSLGLGRNYYLSDLYVAPEARQGGVASALLDWAVAYAGAQGAGGLSLETAHDNYPAQALYERSGWRRESEFRTYFFPLE